jgi:GNAT superfamily N-acetyltransferase
MLNNVTCRIAEAADMPALARLRWSLKTNDQRAPEGEDFARFRDAFVRREQEDRAAGDAIHWLAIADSATVAAMSVILVKKLASPGAAPARWGYLTNCYVVPAHRSSGVGARLLDAIQLWAKTEDLEFLIVWPSEQAFDFYRRSGFSAPDDVLVWTPEQ